MRRRGEVEDEIAAAIRVPDEPWEPEKWPDGTFEVYLACRDGGDVPRALAICDAVNAGDRAKARDLAETIRQES